MSILRVRERAVDLYALGDSPIYYGIDRTVNRFTDNRMADLALAERSQYVEALKSGADYNDTHLAKLKRLQLAQRRHRNRSQGYWIAKTDPAVAIQAMVTEVPPGQIAWAVLATDGAADPIEHYAVPEWFDVAQLDHDALAKLLRRLHECENRVDPQGQARPRAKSALALRDTTTTPWPY